MSDACLCVIRAVINVNKFEAWLLSSCHLLHSNLWGFRLQLTQNDYIIYQKSDVNLETIKLKKELNNVALTMTTNYISNGVRQISAS